MVFPFFTFANLIVLYRKRHNEKSISLGQLVCGDEVEVIEKYETWLKISWINKNGDLCQGWVKSNQLGEIDISI